MRQVLISGKWESPPLGVDIEYWINEKIAVELDTYTLLPKRYIPRFELIRAIRESPRHKAVPVKIERYL